jgi:hypothetical protein
MKFKVALSAVALLIGACTPVVQSSSFSDSKPKVLRMADQAYEPQIKTIQLYPFGAPLLPPVIHLGESNLILEFDDLRGENDTYNARIVHCNYDWMESNIQTLEFMEDYNEFPVSTFEFSMDTHVPYVHYSFRLPRVKISGNYVLVVYRGTDKDDIILSRRFMVHQDLVVFTRDGKQIGPSSIADLNQQINFTINYSGLNIQNPMLDVHVAIRQNTRWDNMASDVKPAFVREIQKELEYRFFDEAKMFRGGNEFRFFDIRSLNYPGRNTGYVNKTVKPFEVYVQKDKSRQYEAYAKYDDLNGQFILENLDYRDLSYSNYAFVNFALQSPEISGDVYVAGAFNYWNLDEINKMHYDSAQGIYLCRIPLKQGWYDYQYVVKSSKEPALLFEGSHFETGNYYEVLVYYRPFAQRADLLVGYVRLLGNER